MLKLCSVSVVVLIALIAVKCNSHPMKVSPKLDFTESRETNIDTKKSSPKYRVVVDASKFKESKTNSDSADDDDEKRMKTIGIRTELTFEVSDEDADLNSTSKEKGAKRKDGKNNEKNGVDADEDNASVPVFKGTHTPGEEPKTHFRPIVPPAQPSLVPSSNRRWNYGGSSSSSGGDGSGERHSPPIFHATDDNRSTGPFGSHEWLNFVPLFGVWTTERTRYHNSKNNGYHKFVPYTIGNQPRPAATNLKPCLCHGSHAPPTSGRRIYYERLPGVDDKLDSPFHADVSL